jgi:AraC-like DNA-binding protein
VLTHSPLLDAPGLRIAAVRCSGPASWSPPEPVGASAVVLVRRGVFARRVDGAAGVADTLTGYVQRPGEVQQVAHPAGGDVCTSIETDPELVDRLAWAGPLQVSPAADLAHRRLIAHAGSGAGHADLIDLGTDLIARLLPPPPRRPAHPAVEEVRAALNADPDMRLEALAELAGCSRWHLSRTFHRVTGVTINTYRLRLRVRAVLEELAGSREGLAVLAARAGFADQAHMTRSIRRELEMPPSLVRKILSAAGR